MLAGGASSQLDDDVDEQCTRRLCPGSSALARKDARLSEAGAKAAAPEKVWWIGEG